MFKHNAAVNAAKEAQEVGSAAVPRVDNEDKDPRRQ